MIRIRRGYLYLCAAAGLALALAPAATAQAKDPAKKTGAAPVKEGEIVKTRQELQKIGAQLSEIQQSAMSKDKTLQKQADKLRAMLKSTMKKKGTDPDVEMKRMEELSVKLRAGNLSKEQSTKLVAEFQSRRQAMEKAQFVALQDKKMKKASEAFQKKMEAAMVKQDPAAKKLLKRYKQLSDKILAMMGAHG